MTLWAKSLGIIGRRSVRSSCPNCRVFIHDASEGKVSPLSLSRRPRKSSTRASHFVARGGRMTTWWRPDLERIRAEIAAEAALELEVKVEASDDDGAKQGTKRKRAPRTKYPKGPCEHGVKQRSRCKVCSACPHGRWRYACNECGGASICEHGRRRSECKECGGSQICEHGCQRSRCKECGGSSICEHGRQRYRCKECKK